MPPDLEKKLTVINNGTIANNKNSDDQTKIETSDFGIDAEEYRQEKTNILWQQAREFRIRNNILVHYSKSLKAEEKFRGKISRVAMWFFATYIGIVLLILIFNNHWGISIADSVLIALLGSTSVNVVGLVTIIIKFIFTNHHHKILDSKTI